MKIIFLDIDGVLNGYNLFVHLKTRMICKNRKLRKYINIFSVQVIKIFILFIIVRLSGAKVVLTSSWRGGYWKVPYYRMTSRCKKLYRLFKIFFIDVIGITTFIYKDRGEQIIDYINDNNITSYVVIDDEMFDIKEYIHNDRLICTKGKDNRWLKFNCAGCYDGAGLKFRDIIPCLKILNRKTTPSEF